MPIYFTVYPMLLDGRYQRPELTIELSSDMTPLARVAPQLPEPLQDGSIRYIAAIPLDKLQAGLYQVRVRAAQAGTTAEESLFVRIE